MPFINTKVSIRMTGAQKDRVKARLGKAIESIPGKSEAWLMIGFEDNYSLYFKGQAYDRIAFVEVKIFGSATEEAYDTLTKEICKIYNEELKIPGDRIYVKYEEVSNWGWNGSNF